jgi:hypothetical protein
VIFRAAVNWMVGCEVEDRDSLAVLGELSEWGREVRAAQAHPTAWFVSDSLSIVLPPLEIVRLLICSWDITICIPACLYAQFSVLYLSIFKMKR